jgi:hypothetical protein
VGRALGLEAAGAERDHDDAGLDPSVGVPVGATDGLRPIRKAGVAECRLLALLLLCCCSQCWK